VLQLANTAEQAFCFSVVAEILSLTEFFQVLAEIIQGFLHMFETLPGDVLELQSRNNLTETPGHPVRAAPKSTGPMPGFKERLKKSDQHLMSLVDFVSGNPDRTGLRRLFHTN